MFLIDLKPGDTLGRYEILMPIAKGGMAAVWAARLVGSRGFQKLVAIKTMLPDLSDDTDFENMFLDEARLASRIRHPHVAEIVDLGDEDGCLYLVMEWVDGETIFTLNKRTKSSGKMPLPILLRIASSTCAGLHAAHELRDDKGNLVDLVHRDISPQNIMVSFDGIVKIVDFGVAKAAGRAYETRVAGIMKGKVPYLSPEQLSSGKVDRRSDIFSLGIMIYVMVSGLHPFRGETDAKTMENICTRSPVPLRELLPNTPIELEAAVLKALQKDPERRWQDCAELQRLLDHISSTLGPPVTDGDVAHFVRTTLGDVIEERRKRLASAIQLADARIATSSTARDRGKPNRPSVRGGAPLPATFEGIIPVSLDDSAPSKPAKEAVTATPTPPASPAVATAPTKTSSLLVAPTGRRRRRSVAPYIILVVLVLLGASAYAMRARLLPVPRVLRNLVPAINRVFPEPTEQPDTAITPSAVPSSTPDVPTTSAPAPSSTVDLASIADAAVSDAATDAATPPDAAATPTDAAAAPPDAATAPPSTPTPATKWPRPSTTPTPSEPPTYP